jgi:hypothetical protein
MVYVIIPLVYVHAQRHHMIMVHVAQVHVLIIVVGKGIAIIIRVSVHVMLVLLAMIVIQRYIHCLNLLLYHCTGTCTPSSRHPSPATITAPLLLSHLSSLSSLPLCSNITNIPIASYHY